MSEQSQSSFSGWAVVEVFGHQRYAGYVTTEAFGQAVLFRVDVPPLAERERVTRHYERGDAGESIPPGSTVKESGVQGYTKYLGPSSIFAMTPCTQEAAEKAVEAMQSRAVSIVTLAPAALELPPRPPAWDDGHGDGEEDDTDDGDLDEPTL